MMLKDKLFERFAYFERAGIKNVKELMQLLKKKDKFAEFSKVDCLQGDYLTVLLRELNSMLPKPNKIADFTGISKDIASKLEKTGIKNTMELYNQVLTKTDRLKLALITGIDIQDISVLTRLADLSRIKWVGATFAGMLCDSGIDTVEKVAEADPVYLHERINEEFRKKGISKVKIGLNDIRILVEAAKEVPIEIEY